MHNLRLFLTQSQHCRKFFPKQRKKENKITYKNIGRHISWKRKQASQEGISHDQQSNQKISNITRRGRSKEIPALQKNTDKTIVNNKSISFIILNQLKWFYLPILNLILNSHIKKNNPVRFFSPDIQINREDIQKLSVSGIKLIYYKNRSLTQASISIIIPDKVIFMLKLVGKDKEGI